jgi:hypothetical protein
MMCNEQPQVSKAGRYPVMEAARRMGCDRRTLWRYADHLRVHPHVNAINNRQYFTGEQLIRIWRAVM